MGRLDRVDRLFSVGPLTGHFTAQFVDPFETGLNLGTAAMEPVPRS